MEWKTKTHDMLFHKHAVLLCIYIAYVGIYIMKDNAKNSVKTNKKNLNAKSLSVSLNK